MTGPGWGSGPWSPPWAGSPPVGGPAVPPGRAPRPVTPPGAPPHDVPQPHALLMRTRDWAWWRPLLGLLLLVVLYAVAAFVVVILALLTGASPDLALTDLTDPAVLLITNASLIVAVPIVWVCWAVAHGVRIGWSSSVLGRLRWRLVLPWTLRALPTLGLAVAATVVLPLAVSGTRVGGPDASLVWLLLVVLLTTPLQSAAEEYVFRGYLGQAIAGWIGHRTAGPVVAAVVTAALFSAGHAPPDWPTFLYRFVMGLALSAVVWLTGGLEAAIVLHAVNNVVLFVLAGLLGDAAVSTESTAVIDGISMLLGVLGMAGYVGWVALSRRSVRPELVSPALDLRGAQQPVPAIPFPGVPPFPFPAVPPPPRWPAPPPDDRWARPS
jgi:membrane protease YdiL (CAAX protease family)